MGIEYDVITEARTVGVRLVVGSPLRWLSTRGHLDPVAQREAPAELLDVLDDLHQALGGDPAALSRKAARPLAVDLVASTGQLIELDELQHFTSARRDSLRWYPAKVTFGFSIEQYRSLIDLWRAKANAVFTRQWSADFDFQGGRRAQRAYYDAVKDLLAPTFTGVPLLRVPVLDCHPRAAAGLITSRLA